jgi:hypothetical protein
MSNLVGCNYSCQRKKQIGNLKETYETGLTQYYSAYNTYLQHKYDKSSNRAWKRMYAEKTLRPKVEKLNRDLNGILEKMKTSISGSSKVIATQTKEIQKKRDAIDIKNTKIKIQDTSIINTNTDLISKNRQIGFTNERNSYRRNILIVLLIMNILIGGAVYKFYKSGGFESFAKELY